MAFPQVAATNTSISENGASHIVSLPAGISVGDLLLVFFATDGDISFSDLDGFTELFSMDNGTANSLSVLYKIAVGSDTLTLVTNESEGSAHVSFRITGHSTSQMPEVSTGVVGVNTDIPDPDLLAPTGGAKDYLWFAAEGNDDDDATTVYPLPDNNLTAIETTCNIGVCSDELNQASLDPGTFTLAAGEQWVACTVVVHPPTVPDECTANNILSGTPVLGTPTATVIHNLAANNLASQNTVLGTPVITQEHVLTANVLASQNPVLGTPAVGQKHALTASNIVAQNPVLGTPVIGQEHILTANGIVAQNPVLGTPVVESVTYKNIGLNFFGIL